MIRILVVEDEKAINNLIYINLKAEGYECTQAYDGGEAAELIQNKSYDLILLDIMLPVMDGFELMEYIRPTNTPVIFITARTGVGDRIRGLKLGADDYIIKPFQIGELIARVEAVLRRMGRGNTEYKVLDVVIDTESHIVKKAGKVIDMTAKEFDLLLELVQHKNVALYREKLYERVWNEPFMGDTRTLDSHIGRLRKKLDWDDHIKTVFRIGYRLEV